MNDITVLKEKQGNCSKNYAKLECKGSNPTLDDIGEDLIRIWIIGPLDLSPYEKLLTPSQKSLPESMCDEQK